MKKAIRPTLSLSAFLRSVTFRDVIAASLLKKKKCNKPLHAHSLRKKKKIIPIVSLIEPLSIQFKSLLLVSSLKCVRQALKKEEEKRTGRNGNECNRRKTVAEP